MSCEGNHSVVQRAVEGVHGIVAVVLRHIQGTFLDAFVPDSVGEDAVQRLDTHHAHLAFKHECCHTFTRNRNIGFHYSRIMLEHVENAMKLLPLSNQCTHRSSIQSITLQRKQSTKQHLSSYLHESNTTFKQQHTHFINHSTDIPVSIAHHSYPLKLSSERDNCAPTDSPPSNTQILGIRGY